MPVRKGKSVSGRWAARAAPLLGLRRPEALRGAGRNLQRDRLGLSPGRASQGWAGEDPGVGGLAPCWRRRRRTGSGTLRAARGAGRRVQLGAGGGGEVRPPHSCAW